MRLFIIIAAMFFLAACDSAQSGIAPITAIPTGESVAVVPSATPTLAAPTPTNRVNAVPTAETGLMATPTIVTTPLPAGMARSIAQATDAALQPTARTPMQFDAAPVPIAFDEFYDGYNLRYGLQISDKLVSLDGRMAVMEGYMAPPLKPELDFFVLTRVRLAFCPFCSTAADWPDDIALVYLPDGQTTYASAEPIRVIGRMEIGQSVDSETGMVSLVRIYAETLETIG